MDSLGVVRQWTPPAEEIFGYSAAQAEGQLLADLIIPEPIRPHHAAGLKRYVETRQGGSVGRTFELEALRQGSGTVMIELVVLPREQDQQLFFEATVRPLH